MESSEPSDKYSMKDGYDQSDELRCLRRAKERAEHKLKILEKRSEEELYSFRKSKLDSILKNSGVREYFQRLNERIKVQDDQIRVLKEDLEFKSKEINELEKKNRDAMNRLSECGKSWIGSQATKEFTENGCKIQSKEIRKHSAVNQNYMDYSRASSIADSSIPPPPPAETSIEEIIQSVSSFRDQFSCRSTSIDIPPPPALLDVPLDEILAIPARKAFKREEGQFVCHVYATIDLETSREIICELIDIVRNGQVERDMNSASSTKIWEPVNNSHLSEDDQPGLGHHVTLLRGHRAVHYHQIKPLIESIQQECRSIKSFSIFLDRFEIFPNHEKTKQFLCLASSQNQLSTQHSCLSELKAKLRCAIDQFATKLTSEDETEDTLAHCSIMSRDMDQAQTTNLTVEIEALDTLCIESVGEFPICQVRIEQVHILIGNHIYDCKLSS